MPAKSKTQLTTAPNKELPPFKRMTPKIEFSCHKVCTAKPIHPRLWKGATFLLAAKGTDVTITFPDRSPFRSGKNPLRIKAGEVREDRADWYGVFECTITCRSCSAGKAQKLQIKVSKSTGRKSSPEMLVDG